MKLFYSWQSDTATNKNLIQSCITGALRVVNDFELETATRDTSGSPDIASTILSKINSSQMMIADVTIINSNSRKTRKMPNPNVMYELGYAVKSLGEDNIILIADRRLTNTADLPFDIRNRRMVLVDFSDKTATQHITESITRALKNYSLPAAQNIPSITLIEPEAVWASNYSDHGASFLVIVSVDNYGGRNDYIVDAKILGTNADGTLFETDSFSFEGQQLNHPYPLKADDMQTLRIFIGSDRNNHRSMPDLDRDTVRLSISFKAGKNEEIPIKIKQN